MSEFFLPIKGHEGFYAVSDIGNVKSLPRIVMRRNGSAMRIKGRILKPSAGPNGYPLVVLSDTEKLTPRTVHSLVLEAFVPKPTPSHECEHRDRDRANPRLGNLRWATRTQNNGNAAHGSGSSLYRGVTKRPSGGWVAQMGQMGKHIFIGEYETQEKAARAYDREASKYFGEFARLNFPISERTAP